jgi:hypothetical protein
VWVWVLSGKAGLMLKAENDILGRETSKILRQREHGQCSVPVIQSMESMGCKGEDMKRWVWRVKLRPHRLCHGV